MKQVLFKKISIQNFLSIGEEILDLNFNTGISLITGENRDKGGRNGVGKSSIIESIYWTLFGNTIRDIKRDKIIHNQSKKGCCVTLEFNVISPKSTDAYILTRRAEPNKVELYCNGVDITRSSMPKTDELVKEIISANEEVFQNAVIMTANNTLPFMAQKKVDKRKFVEGVLHLGVFGEMLLQVRQDYNDAKKEHETVSRLFFDKQKNLDIYKSQFLKNEEIKKSKISKLTDKINLNLEKIKEITSIDPDSIQDLILKTESSIDKKLSKIKELELLSEECKRDYSELQKQEYQIDFDIKQLEKEKKSFLDKSEECPTCKRKYIEDEQDKKRISSLIEEISEKISNLLKTSKEANKQIRLQQKNCDKISKTINLLLDQIKREEKEKTSLSAISLEVSHLKEVNTSLQVEIDELNNTENSFEELIKKLESEIKTQEDEINTLLKKITILESAKFVVSEEGVKTYIIKKMLNILNSKLNFYLQALEAPCHCEFNETFEEVIHNDKGIECSYFNFSGGERKRIDLAILFMFQDVLRMQTGTSFSLSMYDELFDSALDEKGVDKILNILKERVDTFKESIYIVSHNKSAARSNIDQIVMLEKINGVTRLAQ